MKILRLTLVCTLAMVLGLSSCGKTEGDPTPTQVAFKSLTADGSADATTTKLTLSFDKEITALSAADITIAAGETGTTKGELTAKGSGVYELAVSAISASGEIVVTVDKKDFEFTPDNYKVNVFYFVPAVIEEVEFKALDADGSADVTTTKLTLTFDKEVTGLATADVTFEAGSTGAVAGELKAVGGGVYELPLSGITAAGEVTVKVAKEGHNFTPDSKSVAIFWDNKVRFTALEANGNLYVKDPETMPVTTTILTLTFNRDIEGLTADDITITPVSESAVIEKGELTAKGNGVYELGVNITIEAGEVSVTVAKAGEEIEPASLSTQTYIAYAIGDMGPGGGTIFDVAPGGELYDYLEIAPAGWYEGTPEGSYDPNMAWGPSGDDVREVETNEDDGLQNTLNIIATYPDQDFAAHACRAYRGGGKEDWYLPSINEIKKVRLITNVDEAEGTVITVHYWDAYHTSTTTINKNEVTGNDDVVVRDQRLMGGWGSAEVAQSQDSESRVRPIRRINVE